MPPAFLNHRVPTACGTPTPTAASSLAVPAAIAAQNRRRSSRPATGGRPGENKRTRPERSERRFRMFIATPVKVLRRPLESAQYTSVAFGARCKEAAVRPSTGSVGDAYDNAMCESFFATLECELIDRRRFRFTARRGWPSLVHRRLLQSLTPPLGPGLSFAHRIRKETRWPKQARLSPNPSTKAG